MGQECFNYMINGCRLNEKGKTRKVLGLMVKMLGYEFSRATVDDMEAVAKEVLCAIDEWKEVSKWTFSQPCSLPESLLFGQYAAYRNLGDVALVRKQPLEAIHYYNKHRDGMISIGYGSDLVEVNWQITFAKQALAGLEPSNGLLKSRYEVLKERRGESSRVALNAGNDLANALMESGQKEAGMLLFQELMSTAKHVYGRQHCATNAIKSMSKGMGTATDQPPHSDPKSQITMVRCSLRYQISLTLKYQ